MKSEKVFVVLPMFNEGRVIRSVLLEIAKVFGESEFTNLEIVVVNDASTDNGAAEVAQMQDRLPIRLLSHDSNRGLGGALATGLKYVLEHAHQNDIVLTSESDGTQPATVLSRLARLVHEGRDLAIATPLLGADGLKRVALHRRFFSRAGNFVYRTLFPIRGVADYTNLVRAFRARLLLNAFQSYGDRLFEYRGFEAVPDLLIKMRSQKPAVAQIELSIDHSLAQRRSSMRILKTIYQSLRLCFRHLAASSR